MITYKSKMTSTKNLGMLIMNESLARQALNLQLTDAFKLKKGDLFYIDKWSLIPSNTDICFEWKGQSSTAKFMNRGHIIMNGISYKSCHEWVRSVKQNWINAGLVKGKAFPDCDTFREVHYKTETGLLKSLRTIQEIKVCPVATALLSS